MEELNTGMSISSAASRPAWPLLVGIQVSVVAGLMALGIHFSGATEVPVYTTSQRLAELEPEVAEASVEKALQLAKSPLALDQDDQRSLASFLALSAQATGLSWVGVEFHLGETRGAVQDVVAEVVLEGPPFYIPVFIDQLKGYRSVGVVERLEAQAIGSDTGLYRFEITYMRPSTVDTQWVPDAVEGNAETVPTLQKAAGLQAWRAYSEEEPRREARARAMRDSLALALPPGLWKLSRNGEGFVWTPGHGIEPLRSSH